MPHHHGARKARKVRSKSRKLPHREAAPLDRKPDVDFDLAEEAKADACRWRRSG